ncbi:MAG: LacI family DNA-binding transcriptional regulator [Armatimonadota bacterium]
MIPKEPQPSIVTLQAIAARCGVHRSTVHRALEGNYAEVSHKTAEQIRTVAAEMGYDPARHQAARRLINLRHGKTIANNTAALFFPSTFYQYNYFLRLFRGILDTFTAKQYDLITSYVMEQEPLRPLPRSIVRGDVDGVITYMKRPLFEHLQRDLAAEPNFGARPIISLLEPMPHASAVLTDDRKGAYDLVVHLLDIGHRKMAHFCGEEDNYFYHERLIGYRQACSDRGLDPAHCLVHVETTGNIDTDNQPYLDALAATLHRHRDITAVLATDDTLAIALPDALASLGLRVPHDISITGFDDAEQLLVDGSNILTTVHLPLEEIGHAAAQLLLDRMTGVAGSDCTITLPSSIVIRHSTAPPSKRR